MFKHCLQGKENMAFVNYDSLAKIFIIDFRSSHCAKNEIFRYGPLQEMWPNLQFPVDLVTFSEDIRNGKLLSVQW